MTCWWRRGGRWTEADWKERWGNCCTLFIYLFFNFFIFVLVDWLGPFISVWWRRTVAGSKTCSAVSYSFPVSFLFLLLRHHAMNAPTNTHTFKHTFTHSQRTSGYAYYMSPPPLKASLLFSFCSLEPRWWGGSQILHLRAVSLLNCRNQKLLYNGTLVT